MRAIHVAVDLDLFSDVIPTGDERGHVGHDVELVRHSEGEWQLAVEVAPERDLADSRSAERAEVDALPPQVSLEVHGRQGGHGAAETVAERGDPHVGPEAGEHLLNAATHAAVHLLEAEMDEPEVGHQTERVGHGREVRQPFARRLRAAYADENRPGTFFTNDEAEGRRVGRGFHGLRIVLHGFLDGRSQGCGVGRHLREVGSHFADRDVSGREGHGLLIGERIARLEQRDVGADGAIDLERGGRRLEAELAARHTIVERDASTACWGHVGGFHAAALEDDERFDGLLVGCEDERYRRLCTGLPAASGWNTLLKSPRMRESCIRGVWSLAVTISSAVARDRFVRSSRPASAEIDLGEHVAHGLERQFRGSVRRDDRGRVGGLDQTRHDQELGVPATFAQKPGERRSDGRDVGHLHDRAARGVEEHRVPPVEADVETGTDRRHAAGPRFPLGHELEVDRAFRLELERRLRPAFDGLEGNAQPADVPQPLEDIVALHAVVAELEGPVRREIRVKAREVPPKLTAELLA